MTRVKFNQAVNLKGDQGPGQDYSRGVHEVPDHHLRTPHFQNLLKAGLVEEPDTAAAVEPPQDRVKRLANRIAATVKPPQGPPPQAPSALGGQDEKPPTSGDEAHKGHVHPGDSSVPGSHGVAPAGQSATEGKPSEADESQSPEDGESEKTGSSKKHNKHQHQR